MESVGYERDYLYWCLSVREEKPVEECEVANFTLSTVLMIQLAKQNFTIMTDGDG